MQEVHHIVSIDPTTLYNICWYIVTSLFVMALAMHTIYLVGDWLSGLVEEAYRVMWLGQPPLETRIRELGTPPESTANDEESSEDQDDAN